ncbi:fibroblast growth factor receptor 1-like [Antedon mediterranea]|uniref:fibroblast growth factor receptor 1-like n=1 Tax=Antedon mediterranea TaxID=105859 RepID=UPI003AF8B1D7
MKGFLHCKPLNYLRNDMYSIECIFLLSIFYLVYLTNGNTIELDEPSNSTSETNGNAPTLTEILAVVMITIAILCMIIVLLLLWCLRRRRQQRRDQRAVIGNSNNGFERRPVVIGQNSPNLSSIPEYNEPPPEIQQNFTEMFQNPLPRPSYLQPMQQNVVGTFPKPPPLIQVRPPSQASSQYGSETSETTSEMTIADTTKFIKAAVDSYLQLLKNHYQFPEGQVPILPAVPHDLRPPRKDSSPPPIPLPKRSKRKSLTRQNTINMNTYINGYDASKWELPREHIVIEDSPIGSGYFGDVYKAKLYGNQNGNTTVVVKTLKKDSTNREKGQYLKELATHALIEPHKHIVRLIGCCTKSTPYLMILEYAENGSLSEYLFKQEVEKDRGRKNVVNFGHQIADGMSYLSEMKIIHRDLAARNILLTTNEVCKVSDFGFAKDIFGVKTYTKRMSLEPVRWMAPESIKENKFSTKSDVWAYGIVLWEIVTFARSKPYYDVDSHVLRQQIQSGDIVVLKRPNSCSSDIFRIMKWCWCSNPEDRPSFHLLSDIFEDMLEEYFGDLEMSFGEMPDMRPSISSNVDDGELSTIAATRRISTNL